MNELDNLLPLIKKIKSSNQNFIDPKIISLLKDEFKKIDIDSLSLEELKILGFSNWDENLLLAPYYIALVVKTGTIFTTISNKKVIKTDEYSLDLDNRFGLLSYGVSLSDLRNNRLKKIMR